MTKITARDAKDLGFCVEKQKEFCEEHGINFTNYIRHGVDLKEVEGIENANLHRVIAHVKARQGGEASNG